jgi:tRNA pseudouridine38-40 synthase
LVQERNESSPTDDDDNSSSYRIDIRLDGALYKTIHILIGTALEVYRGRIEYNYFVDLIEQPRVLGLTRNINPSKPAPPYGLTLERVYYANDDNIDNTITF